MCEPIGGALAPVAETLGAFLRAGGGHGGIVLGLGECEGILGIRQGAAGRSYAALGDRPLGIQHVELARRILRGDSPRRLPFGSFQDGRDLSYAFLGAQEWPNAENVPRLKTVK